MGTGDVDRELRPCFGVSTHWVGGKFIDRVQNTAGNVANRQYLHSPRPRPWTSRSRANGLMLARKLALIRSSRRLAPRLACMRREIYFSCQHGPVDVE